MAGFLDFVRAMKMLADTEGGPLPEAAPTPPVAPRNMAALLALLQSGAEAGRPNRMGGPMLGGGSGPVNLMGRPDAGDLYDYNYSNGDPGLLNLFGSAPPERRVDGPRPNRRDERR